MLLDVIQRLACHLYMAQATTTTNPKIIHSKVYIFNPSVTSFGFFGLSLSTIITSVLPSRETQGSPGVVEIHAEGGQFACSRIHFWSASLRESIGNA